MKVIQKVQQHIIILLFFLVLLTAAGGGGGVDTSSSNKIGGHKFAAVATTTTASAAGATSTTTTDSDDDDDDSSKLKITSRWWTTTSRKNPSFATLISYYRNYDDGQAVATVATSTDSLLKITSRWTRRNPSSAKTNSNIENGQKPTYNFSSSSSSPSSSSSSGQTTSLSSRSIGSVSSNNNDAIDVATNYIPRGGSGAGSIVNENSECVVDFLRGVDLFGTGLFAFSGALTAGRKGMDLLGMMIVAMITATGGGTVRDILMNQGPVFWLQDSIYTKICVCVTITTFFLWPKLEKKFGIKDSDPLPICYADAFCLGAFAVVGTQKAINLKLQPTLWIVFGLQTATFGGITRDILCLQRPRVMYPERTMYGVPPLLGSAVYGWLMSSSKVQMNGRKAACISIAVTFLTRVLSFNNPTRLPHWKMPTE